jgi:predicted acylesterase/phospholipase RssA
MAPMSRPYLAPDGTDDGAHRRSLVLAGGGMRVAYQAGVLVALDQAGIKFHHVDGTSGGTINLSMVLSGLPVAEICERWRTLNQRGFATPLPLRQYVRSPHWPGLGGGAGLRDQVFPHLGIDPTAIRAAEGVIGTYNLANFATKSSEVIPNSEVDMDALVAGVSLPVLMPGVVRGGVTYTDAVWIRDSNVPEAVRRGSSEVWLVWCIGNTPQYQAGLFRQYVQMIEMAATGSLLGDLEGLAADPAGQHLQLHVIKPATPLPLDPAYYFGRIDAATLIGLGYQDARRYLRDPRPLRAPWAADVTRMQTPAPAVSARIVLDGPLGLGHTDPDAGAEAGLAAGTLLRAQLHCQAPARSSRRGTRMRVAGHLDVPGWPARTLIDEGRALVDGPRAFEWEVTCTVGDKRFEVAGVPCPEGLAVRISEAGDSAVIGAGVLPFGWAEAATTTPTISATNAASSAASWRARIEMARTVWSAARGRGPGA